MVDDVDVVVIGAGMFGSAAGKYLSSSGARVCVVGPAEPARHAQVTAHSFGAHFDEARITRRLGWDHVWQTLDARSLARYRTIEEESGVPFYTELGSLILMAGSISERTLSMLGQSQGDDIPVDRLDEEDLHREMPLLGLPKLSGGVEGLLERTGAGYINPRGLVRAQLELTRQAGGTVRRAAVDGVERAPGGTWVVAVHGDDGPDRIRAGRVLVATGALTNHNAVLPDGLELALHVFTEPNLLLRLREEQVEEYAGLPPVVTIDPDDIGNLNSSSYLVPPVRYPDSNWYARIGPGMQPMVRELHNAADMVMWSRSQRVTDEQREVLSEMIATLLPGLRPSAVVEAGCLIDKTPSRYPYLGAVDERGTFTVAVGGNGHGARGSDEMGRLASRVVLGENWDSPVTQGTFAPVAAGDVTDTADEGFHKPPFGLC
ncbi:MAG: NAD(P)/FAD-dependent oxidoreductase [Phycicoccus sp.]